jgi:hypothetical protein
MLESRIKGLVGDNNYSFANKIRPTIIEKDFKLSIVENLKAFINSWLDDKPFREAKKDMLASKFEKLYADIQKIPEFQQMKKVAIKQSFAEQVRINQPSAQGHGA